MKQLASSLAEVLPESWANITPYLDVIIKAFQDLRYVGEMRQRWVDIKKLQSKPNLAREMV